MASIDNNGKATFQEHTSQVVYTITYNSDTCGTVTKQVTVYPCTQECTCSTTGGLTVPAEASETEVQVGTYSSSNCGGSWSTPTLRSGTDFLKDFRFADGKIYAKVKSTNTDADARSVQYNTGIGTCTDYFTVNQSGTGTCDCTSSRFSVTGVTVDASGGETILIGNFTSECMPLMSFENYAGDTFIDYSKVSTTYDSSTKKGKIYAKVQQNTSSSERMEQPGVLIDGETDFCKHFTVTQAKGICTPELTVSAAGNCCVNFKVVQPCSDIQQYDIIEWGYSKFNSPIFTNGQAFSSKSATGATGISQCPSITSDGDWYIFWRNRTAHSVSGSQYVTLAGCVTCNCSALTLSDTSVSVNASASTSVTYSANCVSITSIAASSTGITIDTGTTGTIKITGNTSGDYTITIKSSADGTTCTDKTISVTVKKSPPPTCQSAFTATLTNEGCKNLSFYGTKGVSAYSEHYVITGESKDCNGNYIAPSYTHFPPIATWHRSLSNTGTTYRLELWFEGDYTQNPGNYNIYPEIKHPNSEDNKLTFAASVCKPTLKIYSGMYWPEDQQGIYDTKYMFKWYYSVERGITPNVQSLNCKVAMSVDVVGSGSYDASCPCASSAHGAWKHTCFNGTYYIDSGYKEFECPASAVPWVCKDQPAVCYPATAYTEVAFYGWQCDTFYDTGDNDRFNYKFVKFI